MMNSYFILIHIRANVICSVQVFLSDEIMKRKSIPARAGTMPHYAQVIYCVTGMVLNWIALGITSLFLFMLHSTYRRKSVKVTDRIAEFRIIKWRYKVRWSYAWKCSSVWSITIFHANFRRLGLPPMEM